MGKDDVNDYLNRGMYGTKQTKVEERNRFLSTLRERIVIALTKSQVRETGTYKQVIDEMNKNPETTLYLNGNMNYTYLRDYIIKATQLNIPFQMVTVKNTQTDIGLVLSYPYAINKEEIFIE
ncbi:YueI family protein [Bacillus carboniphilus]|uniref:YueI family protein n=1 Tax=Bacillus carboniphilus TaxID=86663 RepID=A0ABY9JWB1_9BACI|nr:YueI family protein [Bacillus carboniphilus]WLR43058.1 YueI family protein [Bacillus carboniphilus]